MNPNKTITVSFRITPSALAQVYGCLTGLNEHNPTDLPNGYSKLIKTALGRFCQFADYDSFNRPPNQQHISLIESWGYRNKAKKASTINQFGTQNYNPNSQNIMQTQMAGPIDNNSPQFTQQAIITGYNMEPYFKEFKPELRDSARHLWKSLQSGATSIEENLSPQESSDSELTEINLTAQFLTANMLAGTTLHTFPELASYREQAEEIIAAWYEEKK